MYSLDVLFIIDGVFDTFFILEYVYITADSTKYTQHICSIVQHI